MLRKTGKLPQKYKTHRLIGNYEGFLECHLKPDWLLIWEQNEETKTIYLAPNGNP